MISVPPGGQSGASAGSTAGGSPQTQADAPAASTSSADGSDSSTGDAEHSDRSAQLDASTGNAEGGSSAGSATNDSASHDGGGIPVISGAVSIPRIAFNALDLPQLVTAPFASLSDPWNTIRLVAVLTVAAALALGTWLWPSRKQREGRSRWR